MRTVIITIILSILSWVPPAMAGNTAPAAGASPSAQAAPPAGAPPQGRPPKAPSKEDLKIISLMDTLRMLNLAESMDMARDMDVLIEEGQHAKQK
jgi:hypothetical protein